MKASLNELREIENCKKCSCIFKDRMIQNMAAYEKVIDLYNKELARLKG